MATVDVNRMISKLKCEVSSIAYDNFISESYGIKTCKKTIEDLRTLDSKMLLIDLLSSISYLNYVDESLPGCDKNVVKCDLTKIYRINNAK